MRSINRFGDSIDAICGTADESQEVEQYDGSLGVSVEFVKNQQKKVGQVQWNTPLPTAAQLFIFWSRVKRSFDSLCETAQPSEAEKILVHYYRVYL